MKIYKTTIIAIVLIGLLIAFSGCAQQTQEELAVQQCKILCQQALQEGRDLSNGPCLSDSMEFNVQNWVCDIAHSPRAAVDNLRENQCDEWHSGAASHFVEFSPECEFVQKH